MNTLRPSILRIPRSNTFPTVANNHMDGCKLNAAAFTTWKSLRRVNCSYYMANWNQLRPYHHICTTDTSNDEKYTTNDRRRFSIKAFSSSPSTLLSTLPCTHYWTPLHSPPALLDTRYSIMKVSIRGMSSINNTSNSNNKSKDFSTIPHNNNMHHHSTIANGNNNNADNNKHKVPFESLPASQKARILFKQYGTVFVGTYFGIYFSTLVSFFVILDFGLLDPDTLSQIFKVSKNMACETADIIGPTGTGASMNEAANAYAEDVRTETIADSRTFVDIVSGYLKSWDWTKKYAEKLSENPHLANLAVAWFIVKFTEPVRLAAAVVVTPKVAKVLKLKKDSKKKSDESTA